MAQEKQSGLQGVWKQQIGRKMGAEFRIENQAGQKVTWIWHVKCTAGEVHYRG